jgi:hypothetical protein
LILSRLGGLVHDLVGEEDTGPIELESEVVLILKILDDGCLDWCLLVIEFPYVIGL